MPSTFQLSDIWLPCLVLLVFWARPTAAFGAGNIASLSSIEGQNWRHGDIEDTLLNLLISTRTGKKFSKFDVKRVYFGNWLRDYSQAVDVGTVKMVSAEAIRILLWVLGFLSFGYGTKEFEVTRDRLGCYRPEEHIDNPKDYADNLDARDYDRRLRGPVDEERELSVDERTGLKNYIASEDKGITTSAAMVRDLLRRCIDLGRRSGGHGDDFHEALRLLGTATHCMEDYSAHSNYVELALVELGEEDIFPHVGRNTRLYVEAAGKEVWPIITGTFGGVDFLHSVCGEFTDKTTQSELQELEGAITNADRSENKSKIKDLLSQLPDGIFGGKDQAGKADELEQSSNAAAMGNMRVSPKEPEEFTQQIGELVKQIYPIMEFHDDIMRSIAMFIEKVPILPDLIEQIQDQITVFIFSLLAPFILPILTQVKTELEEGSSQVIQSSREKQHVVFNDDDSSDPTHSMLSKDHFSNLLNEPAGRVASAVLTWAVPQIVECWDGEGDSEETISRIIDGVFHHPAAQRSHVRGSDRCRSIMLNTVREWWENKSDGAKDELREKLSRNGVKNGENHKPGQQDKGHGCCKPLGMAKQFTEGGSGNKPFQQATDHVGKLASEAVGGGALGGLVGGLVGGIGGSLLGSAFGDNEKQGHQTQSYGQDGSYTQSYGESGHHQRPSHDEDRYGQAEYSQTQYPGGGRREEYNRQEEDGGNSYSYQQRVSTSSYSGGTYERHEERRVESGGEWRSEERREGIDSSGQYYNEERERRGSGDHHRRPLEGGYSSSHHRQEESSYSRQENSGYGQENSGYGQENSGYGRESSGYGRESSGYGRESSGYGREGSGQRQESSYNRQEGGYGGGRRHDEESFGDDRMPGGFGNEEESSGYGGRRQEYGSGGGYNNGGDSYDRRY